MIFGLIGVVTGMVLGSFVKVLGDRGLNSKSFWGRSYCPKCQKKLAWYDLFPVFSFLYLQGKCRYCHKRIGKEYLVVEVVMGILVGFLFWQNLNNVQFTMYNLQLVSNFKLQILIFELIFKTFFIVILVALFLTDLKKMLIPDRIVLPSIVIGTISLFLITIYKIGYLYYYLGLTPIGRKLLPPYSDYFQRHAFQATAPFFWSLIMALLIGGFFFGLIVLTKGKGMGGGDVKLGAFIGIMLGFPNALFAMFLAFLSGALFSIILIISGKKHFGQVIPFGPFLVLGSLLMLFWGNQILDWYMMLGR